MNFISWGDAARFANWLHNGQPTGAPDLTTTEDGSYFLNGKMSDFELEGVVREPDATWVIPTEQEWYKAAYHKNDGATGSYFNFPTASDSAAISNDLIDPDPGHNATYQRPGPDFTIGMPYFRTEVGSHENSESAYGTFDQGGNVLEFNESVPETDIRGIRGGSWFWATSASGPARSTCTRRTSSASSASAWRRSGRRARGFPRSPPQACWPCCSPSFLPP